MRGRCVVLCALAVAACSAPAPPVVERFGQEPNARKLVSEIKIFNQDGARVTALSKPRPWKHLSLYAWRVCARAAVPGPNGGLSPKTYALFIHANDITDRREAIADDLCGGEAFEPFTPEPVFAAVEPSSPPPPRTESSARGGLLDWFRSGR